MSIKQITASQLSTGTTYSCRRIQMWPVILQFVRSKAPYLTLPFAALVGIIGYNIENLLSDKYTPYNKAVQEQRLERLSEDEALENPTNVKKLKYQENVLGRNLSPSLEGHKTKS